MGQICKERRNLQRKKLVYSVQILTPTVRKKMRFSKTTPTMREKMRFSKTTQTRMKKLRFLKPTQIIMKRMNI